MNDVPRAVPVTLGTGPIATSSCDDVPAAITAWFDSTRRTGRVLLSYCAVELNAPKYAREATSPTTRPSLIAPVPRPVYSTTRTDLSSSWKKAGRVVDAPSDSGQPPSTRARVRSRS